MSLRPEELKHLELFAKKSAKLPVPAESSPNPTVVIDVPPEWKLKEFPLRLDLKKKKVSCGITILKDSDFQRRQGKNAHRLELQKVPNNPWAVHHGTWSPSLVEFGECRGEKQSYTQEGERPWMHFEYLLEVPGGFVSVFAARADGEDFDEAEIEGFFHTIKVMPAKIIGE